MSMDLSDDLAELIKGTNTHLVSDTSAAVMHDRIKVPTPIPQLNCIFGGGIPMGVVLESYGEPASGKTSTWYQTMGNFQRLYPDGVSIIVDTEASVDSQRMPFMGCDPNKTLRIPCESIESGFSQLFQILDRKEKNERLKSLPVFVIWDTISVGATEKQLESGTLNSGGMMEKPRILKNMLQLLMPRIEKQPILIALLNQVTTEMTQFGGRLTSGGGWAVKHNAHIRIKYVGGKTDYDGIYATVKHSTVNLDKSKISPLFQNISIVIDITRGGIVDGAASMAEYASDVLHYINHSSWCDSKPLAEMYPEYVGCFDKFCSPEGRFRYNEYLNYAENNSDYVTLLELAFTQEICNKYTYQAKICAPYIQKLKDQLSHLIEPELDVITDTEGNQIIDEVDDKSEMVITDDNDMNLVDTATGEIIS